jgi:hypothetical protein
MWSGDFRVKDTLPTRVFFGSHSYGWFPLPGGECGLPVAFHLMAHAQRVP